MLPALLAVTLAASAGPRFVEDDYTQALAQARREKKLLFVDAWAPWCHSCIFLREQVFTQPGFRALEKDVVFAALDTEKKSSAPFLAKYPVPVLPTLFFIAPATGEVLVRWAGTLDLAQMKSLVAAAQHPEEADRLLAQGRDEEAAKLYVARRQQALDGRELLSMLAALNGARDFEGCAKAADEAAPRLKDEADKVGVLAWGLGCALELDAQVPAHAARRTSLAAQAREGVKLAGALEDDTSGLYELLVAEREAAGDAAGAMKVAQAWLAFLEAAAARTATPSARAVYDPHRVNAALAAKTPERAMPALAQSEKDFPADYNPPARLALLLEAQGKYAEALVANGRALGKCAEGPRKLRLFETQARLLGESGDAPAQVKALEAALQWAERLPAAQVPEARLQALVKALVKAKGAADGGAR